MSGRRLCRESKLGEGACREFSLKIKSAGSTTVFRLFLVRKRGQVYAYRNRCPHTGVTLNWQPDQFLDMDGVMIQCATHGALFRISDGYCLQGPCAGQSLEAVAIEIIDDEICLTDAGRI
jgi:nitrite reductase/ring-hydroxylating ferredoxin subunit